MTQCLHIIYKVGHIRIRSTRIETTEIGIVTTSIKNYDFPVKFFFFTVELSYYVGLAWSHDNMSWWNGILTYGLLFL